MTRDPVALAEIENDMKQTKRENECGPGEEHCAHCGEQHEEGDMYRLGGDGDWMCVPCIRGTSDEWRRARQLMAQAAAILRLHTTQEAARVANEMTLIVEGR